MQHFRELLTMTVLSNGRKWIVLTLRPACITRIAMNRGNPRPPKNAMLIDKPTLRPGLRSLSLKGGARRPGRLYWYVEYAATEKAAKAEAYQAARDCAEIMQLRIMDERVN